MFMILLSCLQKITETIDMEVVSELKIRHEGRINSPEKRTSFR